MKIKYLFPILILMIACASVDRGQLERAQTAKDRHRRHPDPKIYFIHNDYILGVLYNGGKRFSDEGFMEYIKKHTPKGAHADFFYGINMHGQRVIKYAVISYEDTNKKNR